MLLTVNSKNEEENALSGLRRPDSVLKPEDFVSIKANWNPKNLNLTETARELSLLPESSNVYVSLQLFDRERFEREGMEVYDYISVALRMDSPRCMQWLREHYDFEIISERELQQRAAADLPADSFG